VYRVSRVSRYQATDTRLISAKHIFAEGVEAVIAVVAAVWLDLKKFEDAVKHVAPAGSARGFAGAAGAMGIHGERKDSYDTCAGQSIKYCNNEVVMVVENVQLGGRGGGDRTQHP
jgi:hypothetical protein